MTNEDVDWATAADPTDEPLMEWEEELLAAADAPSPDMPVPLTMEERKRAAKRAAADPDVRAAVQSAAKAMKAALAAPRPADAPEAVRPDFVRAKRPPVLHTIAFPVYDRQAKGYRIIERAFGVREVKVLLKTLLDTFLGTDEQTEPAHMIDAAAHLFPTAAPSPSLERIGNPFKCSRGIVHDARAFRDLTQGRLVPSGRHREMKDFITGIAQCYQAQDMHSRDYNDEGFRTARLQQYPEARQFVESHFPFLAYNGSQWYANVPYEIMHALVLVDSVGDSTYMQDLVDWGEAAVQDVNFEDRSVPGWTLTN